MTRDPVPDYTLATGRFDGDMCLAIHPTGYGCTRSRGHTGRHAAGTSVEIVAVWR